MLVGLSDQPVKFVKATKTEIYNLFGLKRRVTIPLQPQFRSFNRKTSLSLFAVAQPLSWNSIWPTSTELTANHRRLTPSTLVDSRCCQSRPSEMKTIDSASRQLRFFLGHLTTSFHRRDCKHRAVGWHMNNEMKRIWKEAVLACPRYHPGHCLEGLMQAMKHTRTSHVPIGIRTEHLSNISLERCLCITLFGLCSWRACMNDHPVC
jgi:hypothetical protein